MIENILTNKILITVILAGFISQLTKIFLMWKIDKRPFELKDLIVTGGMPSTHSALVISLLTIIFLQQQFSPLFIVSLVLATIVVTDSMGVRRTAGEEGEAIQLIAKKTKVKLSSHHFALGHTPKQVVAGSILGFAVAIMVYFL